MLLTPGLAPPLRGQNQTVAERIAFAAYRRGQWDIFSISPTGSDLRQLTNDSYQDSDPAYAPDGTKIAFASRRDNNWDLYVLDLRSGEELQLTNSAHYDGAPSWSPDGQQLAYESYAAGDLDIWLVAAAGGEPAINLTADSAAGDFGPAWSPTGRSIAFTSWREGDKDLFLLDVATKSTTQLTTTPTAEEWPAWHPNGNSLVFVVNDLGDSEVFALDLATSASSDAPHRQVTWLGRTSSPVWSPTGQALAVVFHRWDGEGLAILDPDPGSQLPQEPTGIATIRGRLSWHKQAVEYGRPVSALEAPGPSPLYEETLTPNGSAAAEPYNLIRQNDIIAGTPWLADTVDDSFQAWRARLRQEVGYDFLGELSDAARDVSAYSDTSQYASWHKSGRAIDTLFDYHVDERLVHEIEREDYSGETYWRVHLRCIDQTGRCGRPLIANPWNYSRRARTELGPEQGGVEKANQLGYYVDMTAMAREYGWERISSFDDNDYSWTWHFLAFEYWHYQKRLDGDDTLSIEPTDWYQAMGQVYPPEVLAENFTWDIMRGLGEDPHLIALKGVPLPLEVKPWWALLK